MNWHIIIGILAGVLQLAAIPSYLKDILKGNTRPNIVSWALWTLIQVIGIWVMVTSPDGFSWSLVLLAAATFNTSAVVVLCFLGYGSKEFGRIELICLILALIAIGLWVTVKNSTLTLTFDILADLVAATPTLVKTWKEPRSEAVVPWVMVSAAAFLGALSTTIVDVENLALPIYLGVINGLIALIAYAGQRRTPPPVTSAT
ncbi:MAG: hypothetical protein QG626_225 [Patescibacteria group bacterium]|nr:hypothetical protein [Patescibacteria group bacterium]